MDKKKEAKKEEKKEIKKEEKKKFREEMDGLRSKMREIGGKNREWRERSDRRGGGKGRNDYYDF